TALMGGTLPALARHAITRPDGAERRLAALYAANTWGGVAGTLLCGFTLIPVFGVRRTSLLAVLLNTVVGAAAWLWASRRGGGDGDRVAGERRRPALGLGRRGLAAGAVSRDPSPPGTDLAGRPHVTDAGVDRVPAAGGDAVRGRVPARRRPGGATAAITRAG